MRRAFVARIRAFTPVHSPRRHKGGDAIAREDGRDALTLRGLVPFFNALMAGDVAAVLLVTP
jgi:hypothetical protein